jgi:hypothetical protein
MNLSEHVILIHSYANTELKREILYKCLESLKNFGIDVILSSSFPDDEKIQNIVYKYIYNENHLIFCNEYDKFKIMNTFYFINDYVTVIWKYKYDHHYAAYTNIRNGYLMAKSLNKTYIHLISYDCMLDKESFFKEMVHPVMHHDISCKIDNGGMDLNLISFKIDAFKELFDIILSKEDFYIKLYPHKIIEKKFYNFCMTKMLKYYYNKYPLHSINMLTVASQNTQLKYINLCTSKFGKMYLQLHNSYGQKQLNIIYNNTNINIDIESEQCCLYEIGEYVKNSKFTIMYNSNIIYTTMLEDTSQEFHEYNMLTFNDEKILKKYICISTCSTMKAKLWNNSNGWQTVVNYLVSKGYVVINLSIDPPPLENVESFKSIELLKIVQYLQHAAFFIGLGSGISWLAWALNKKVVLIAGFSNPISEFTTNCIRIHNPSVCNSCYNDASIPYKKDWDWCPRNKNFECSKEITSETVIAAIQPLIK